MRKPLLCQLAFVVAIAALAASASPFAPDDFLHSASRDLSARQRDALAQRVTELGNPDPYLRNRAIRWLAAIARPALPALTETLKHGSETKQLRNACLALGALGDATSLALLEHWLQDEAPAEEPARAALFALMRGRGTPSPELSERLRGLALESPLATVREAAVLCAGARKVAGLPDALKAPLKSEKSARLIGCMLVALAESGDPAGAPLIARFLDARHVHDEKLHRAALYAVARLGDPSFLALLLKFEPDQHEVLAYSVALGAFTEPTAVDALGKLLVKERERAVDAVWSLANVATPEAKGWLKRALTGEFSDAVRAEAALAVADLTEQQLFLPGLHELAAAPVNTVGKSQALLALARIGDGDAAAGVAQELATWRDRDLLERGLLLCARTLDVDAAKLLPEARRAPVASLWREIDDVKSRHRDPRLIDERIAGALTRARAHWTLRRDDLRDATVHELLELDRIVYADRGNQGQGNGDSSNGNPGGGNGGGTNSPPSGGPPPPPVPPPPPPPGDGGGSGGSGDGGGASGSGGSGGGNGSGAGSSTGVPRGRGRQDQTRFELDLKLWLGDFPPFECAHPFER